MIAREIRRVFRVHTTKIRRVFWEGWEKKSPSIPGWLRDKSAEFSGCQQHPASGASPFSINHTENTKDGEMFRSTSPIKKINPLIIQAHMPAATSAPRIFPQACRATPSILFTLSSWIRMKSAQNPKQLQTNIRGSTQSMRVCLILPAQRLKRVRCCPFQSEKTKTWKTHGLSIVMIHSRPFAWDFVQDEFV